MVEFLKISGPRPDLDPDIVAALDDDFNFDDPDNELEDDFIAAANGVPSDAETEYATAMFQNSVFNLHYIFIVKTKKTKIQMTTAKKTTMCYVT